MSGRKKRRKGGKYWRGREGRGKERNKEERIRTLNVDGTC